MRVSKGTHCSAINCYNNKGKRPDLKYFRFPKDPIRCRKWVLSVRRADFMTRSTLYLYKNAKLCSLHFEKPHFMDPKQTKLVHDAMPTKFNFSKCRDNKYSKKKPIISKDNENFKEEYTRLFPPSDTKSKDDVENQNSDPNGSKFVSPDKWCSVRGCPNNITQAIELANLVHQQANLTLYEFPKEYKIRCKWINFCVEPDHTYGMKRYVCSNHFVRDDFIESTLDCNRKPVLKDFAVPTVHGLAGFMQMRDHSYYTSMSSCALGSDNVSGHPEVQLFKSNLESNLPKSSKDTDYAKNVKLNIENHYLSLQNESLRSQLKRSEDMLVLYKAKCEKQALALKRLESECTRMKQNVELQVKDNVEVINDLFEKSTSTYIAKTSEAANQLLIADVYTIEELL